MTTNKIYHVLGDKRVGWKLTLPASQKKSTHYICEVQDDGSLLYTPVKL
jgi:hypothetical protein